MMIRSKTMRSLAAVTALAAAGTLAPQIVAAQAVADARFGVADAPALRGAQSGIYIGPQIAFNDDADLGIGAALEFDLPSIDPALSYMGDFTIFFPGDDFDYFEINTNLTYDLPLENASVVPFVLGGLNIARASFDGGPGIDSESDTEIGLNLGGGVKFDAGSVQPRVGARAVLGGSETFTLWVAVPFRVAN